MTRRTLDIAAINAIATELDHARIVLQMADARMTELDGADGPARKLCSW